MSTYDPEELVTERQHERARQEEQSYGTTVLPSKTERQAQVDFNRVRFEVADFERQWRNYQQSNEYKFFAYCAAQERPR